MSRPFHVKVLNRTRRWTDRAYSLFETRASLGPTRERLDYDERLALREIGWALREPGAVVYDVGAALGTYTSAAAKLRTVDLVVAFEPLSASFRSLEQRVATLPNVRAFNVAVGSEAARLPFRAIAWANTSSFLPVSEVTRTEFPLAAELASVEEVDVVRLDDLVEEHELPPPRLLKIDVQGFEGHVVAGATETLERTRYCITEVSFKPLYEGAPLFDEIYDAFVGRGFRLAGLAGELRSSTGEQLQADAVFERKG